MYTSSTYFLSFLLYPVGKKENGNIEALCERECVYVYIYVCVC